MPYTIPRATYNLLFHHETKLIELFKGYLGDDAEIRITYENEIPQLASGKRRLIINNYKKGNNNLEEQIVSRP